MKHLDVPWAEDNSERSMKNSVIAGTVLSSFPVIVLLRGCRDTWLLYERILLTNCQDFDQSRNPSELPRERVVGMNGFVRNGAFDGFAS
ncbi:MAG: hypothetical protein AUF79_10850 [Crenarchaeota archaeon 13_1_20CM_2_51_8]|nr:MAG: hypothetical protein AUF79_10850 [Crenarchaeota archaeon 13_1_20CM_2_51_8]